MQTSDMPAAKRTAAVVGTSASSNVDATQLSKLRTSLHDVLWGGGAQSDSDIFNLLSRLILAKIHDERVSLAGQRAFRVETDETLETALRRIDGLYSDAVGAHMLSEDAGPVRQKGKGTDEQIRFAVEKLSSVDLSGVASNGQGQGLIGDFFEQIMRDGFKQSQGQFFTHPNIAEFMVSVSGVAELAARSAIDGGPPPSVIDPSAGSGGFLTAAIRAMSAVAGVDSGRNVVGLEINSDLGLAAQVNMLLHGDGSSSVFAGPEHGDGLADLASYPKACSLLAPRDSTIAGYDLRVCERFDVVLTNPPFSAGISDGERRRYEQSLESAGRTSGSEHLFVERWFQLLKPGGRLAAVVPDSLLDARTKSVGRDYLIRYFWVRAVVSLPSSAFYPHTSTKTSIVFAQKKTHEEIAHTDSSQTADAMLSAHGHISMHQASALGYKRTQKQEMAIERNDLTKIAKELGAAQLWMPAVSANQHIQNRSDGGEETSSNETEAKEQPRLDVGFTLWQQKCAAAKDTIPATDLFDVGWIAGATPDMNAEGQWIVEIGDLDRSGRSTPKWVPNDMTAEEHHPETQNEMERLLSKIGKNKFGPVPPWTVLAPKTRPYLRKFGLYGPDDGVLHTSDLLALQPKSWLSERCSAVEADVSMFNSQEESERAVGCCLLWLLCAHGPVGDLLALIARWGKEYPTLHLADIQTASISESLLCGWVEENEAVRRSAELRGLVLSTAGWQQAAVYEWQ